MFASPESRLDSIMLRYRPHATSDRLILSPNRADVVPLAGQPTASIHPADGRFWYSRSKCTGIAGCKFRTASNRLEQAHGFDNNRRSHRVRFQNPPFAVSLNVRNLFPSSDRRLPERFLRIQHVILGPRTSRQDVARRQLLRPAPPRKILLNDLLLIALVVDYEILRESRLGAVPARYKENPQRFNIPP